MFYTISSPLPDDFRMEIERKGVRIEKQPVWVYYHPLPMFTRGRWLRPGVIAMLTTVIQALVCGILLWASSEDLLWFAVGCALSLAIDLAFLRREHNLLLHISPPERDRTHVYILAHYDAYRPFALFWPLALFRRLAQSPHVEAAIGALDEKPKTWAVQLAAIVLGLFPVAVVGVLGNIPHNPFVRNMLDALVLVILNLSFRPMWVWKESGGNDNSSGVHTAIEIARQLAGTECPVTVALTVGEEVGMQGAACLVRHSIRRGEDALFVAVDMVGDGDLRPLPVANDALDPRLQKLARFVEVAPHPKWGQYTDATVAPRGRRAALIALRPGDRLGRHHVGDAVLDPAWEVGIAQAASVLVRWILELCQGDDT